MTEKVSVTAGSIEEALAKAASRMKVDQSDLDYSVISDKKGLLGLTRTVKLEVWVGKKHNRGDRADKTDQGQVGEQASQALGDKAAQILSNIEQTDRSIEGTVAVIDGQLKVTSPQGEGKPAVIIPAKHIELVINGKKISNSTQVTEADEIVVNLDKDEPSKTELRVELSADNMTATGILDITKGYSNKLAEHGPCQKLPLAAIRVEQPLEKLTRDEVMVKLANAKVVYGVEEAGIRKLLEATQSIKVIVAQGMKGKPPEDEKLEYLFGNQQEEVDHKGRVDYREKNTVVSVLAGDVLAVKTPAKLGEKGIDVTGKVWEPPFPKMVKIQAGQGVELSPDGQKFLATRDGQPVVKSAALKVIPVYQAKAVNLDSGNIRFNGSVVVSNNVEENMLVDAKEEVEVYGSVTMAEVKAGGNIEISKNAVGSRIQAGGEAATSQTILKHLNVIPPLLSQMEAKSKAAREAISKKGMGEKVNDGYLIKIMMENMFPQLEKSVKELVGYVEESELELDTDVSELIKVLKKSFLGLGPTQLKFEQVRLIKQLIFRVVGVLQQIAENKANVKIGYVQNSQIEASGEITITGKGCYNSDLNAGGTVKFTGRPGVFRGGNIVAGDDVEVGELGSPNGTATSVTVPKLNKIKARVVYPNVVIKVGGFSEKIQTQIGNYEAWVSERGLETVKLKN